MISARKLVRRAAEILALGALGMYASLSGAVGCGSDMACIQWSESEGACPAKGEAIKFMAPSCDQRLTVESEGEYDGVTCCYDVTKQKLEGCAFDGTSGVSGAVATSGGTTVVASSASSTGSGPGACDGMGNCDNCQECAKFGNCSGFESTCQQNAECGALRDCLAMCPPNDTTCAQTCANVHANGVPDLEALLDCTQCQECPLDCGCSSG